MIAANPRHGGATWAVLQYLLGFRRLGHEVYFVESVPGCSTDSARYFEETMCEFGFAGRAALLVSGTHESVGLEYAQLQELARYTDVLINLSGTLREPELLAHIPVRVYLDLDPGFTQVWHKQSVDMGFGAHTHFVTVGLSVGEQDCPVPTAGVEWLTTLQPVVLEYWPACPEITGGAFTSVANWRAYGSIENDGVVYGQKAHSVREYIDLPTLTSEKVVLALGIHPDERTDLAALLANKWCLVSPDMAAGTPAAYQRFIQRSKAELGIAKKGYVAAQTAWFSDRSICYLASGRPVIAQDTGFSRFLPTDEGLLTFTTTEHALERIDEVNADFARHSRAARNIAEEYFDSDIVLGRLLDLVGATSQP